MQNMCLKVFVPTIKKDEDICFWVCFSYFSFFPDHWEKNFEFGCVSVFYFLQNQVPR